MAMNCNIVAGCSTHRACKALTKLSLDPALASGAGGLSQESMGVECRDGATALYKSCGSCKDLPQIRSVASAASRASGSTLLVIIGVREPLHVQAHQRHDAHHQPHEGCRRCEQLRAQRARQINDISWMVSCGARGCQAGREPHRYVLQIAMLKNSQSALSCSKGRTSSTSMSAAACDRLRFSALRTAPAAGTERQERACLASSPPANPRTGLRSRPPRTMDATSIRTSLGASSTTPLSMPLKTTRPQIQIEI